MANNDKKMPNNKKVMPNNNKVVPNKTETIILAGMAPHSIGAWEIIHHDTNAFKIPVKLYPGGGAPL